MLSIREMKARREERKHIRELLSPENDKFY